MRTNLITKKITLLIISGIISLYLPTVFAQEKGSLDLVVTVDLTSPRCNGSSSGFIALTAHGGIAPYSYLWSNGFTTSTLNNVSAGTYNVTITDSIGSFIEGIINLEEPDPIQISSSVSSLTSASSSNGTIDVTVNGGTPGYSYSWETMNGSHIQSSEEDQINLGIGNYSLTVTDDNGCEAHKDFIIRFKAIKPIFSSATNSSEPNIKMYPNPSYGEVNFKVDQEVTKYEIYNSTGNLTETLITDPTENNPRTMNLDSGTYTVLFYGISGIVRTEKLMVK